MSTTARLWSVLILAFAVRALGLFNAHIEHFDEGVYAANLYCGHLDFHYPDQHLYAPPLWPTALEWSLLLSGGMAGAPLWLGVLLGTLLTAAVYGLVLEWQQDESTALCAALLVATNDFAIAYSRTALTDTPFTLSLVLGLWLGSRALISGTWLWLLVGTVCGGLAWWTKYNGWLLPAMWGAGIAGWWCVERPAWTAVKPVLIRWSVMTLGVVLLWSPVLWSLQSTGGYAAVAANHRGYFGGLAHWADSLGRQLAVQAHYLSPLTWLGLGGACWLGRATGGQVVNPAPSLSSQRLFTWVLVAWGLSLIVAVPLYRPYPRLWLPLELALCVWGAAGINVYMRRTTGSCRWLSCGVCVMLAGVAGARSSYSAWESRSGLQAVSVKFMGDLPGVLKSLPPARTTDWDCLVYVLGEPGLFFHVAQASETGSVPFIAQPASGLDSMSAGPSDRRLPNLLLTGLHAHRAHPELLQEKVPGLELLQEYPCPVSDLVLLDDVPPADLPQQRTQMVRLWRILP